MRLSRLLENSAFIFRSFLSIIYYRCIRQFLKISHSCELPHLTFAWLKLIKLVIELREKEEAEKKLNQQKPAKKRVSESIIRINLN